MAGLSDCFNSPHHYQAPQLACWPTALEGSGSLNRNPQTAATLYSLYLAAAATRMGIGSRTEMHQVMAALAAAITASPATTKDSRWLTLEVCRQYQRKMCSRDENECKFAHPPPHVDVQNGRIICCYDSIKGKCQRRDPPCKYFHPPQHLRELLLQNGRNNLMLKNMQLQLLQQQLAQGAMIPGLSAALVATASTPSGASLGAHGIARCPNQCPNPTSPPPSTSIGPAGKLIYSPSLNLNPQGMVTAYSLMLPQPMPPTSQPRSTTVPPSTTAANLDVSSTPQLVHLFTPPQSAVVDPLCASLYTQAQTSSTAARKRLVSACVNDAVSVMHASLFPALTYGPQLDSLLYQLNTQPIASANPLGVGLSPYLTATQLTPIAMAAGSLKSVPPTASLTNGSGEGVGGLSAAHLAAMVAAASVPTGAPLAPPAAQAKRPALADAKSGLPLFDYGQGLYTLQPQAQFVGAKNLHLHPPLQLQSQASQSASAVPVGDGEILTKDNGVAGPEKGGPSEVEVHKPQLVTVGQMFPKTYIEIPLYGYQ